MAVPALLAYPAIDPVIFRIGPLAIRWYGIAYLVGFLAAFLFLKRDARRRGWPYSPDDMVEGILWFAVGLIVGARVGYMAVYDLGNLLAHPQDVVAIWQGGMSFHGGLIGGVAAGVLWAWRRGKPFYPGADAVAAAAPIGLMLGRLANFMNGELWGRPSTLPWAMVFPGAGPQPRHPSQIYEALLEGVVLFVVMRVLMARRLPPGVVLWCFVALYGVSRFAVEFTRQPDPQLGLLLAGLSMGQLLSLPMVVVGAWMVWRLLSRTGTPGGGAKEA